MAGQKARIDKDSKQYLDKDARPDAEQETAYKTNKELEAKADAGDEPGPVPVNFHGGTKKDRSRRADQTTSGTTGIGDTGNGLDKMESSNPFASVIKAKFYSEAASYGREYPHSHVMQRVTNGDWEAHADIKPGKTLEITDNTKGGQGKRTTIRVAHEKLHESENPGVASAPATSDAPSLGMYSVNNTDFRQQKIDVRHVLESIALQAAETFEMLDENSNVPDPIINDLQTTAKAVSKIYEYVNKNTMSDTGDPNDTSSVPKETPQGKPGVNEETEELDEKLIGNQDKIDANKNGKLDAHDFKLLRAKKTMKEAVDLAFAEILRGKLDADS